MTKDEAITALRNAAWLGSDAARDWTEQAVEIAVEALQADAVSVVRCRDCKFAHITHDGKYCKFCELERDDDGFLIEQYYESDYFCACGERREGDGE